MKHPPSLFNKKKRKRREKEEREFKLRLQTMERNSLHLVIEADRHQRELAPSKLAMYSIERYVK
tara:strand:- start:80 stop:271 length:192 start_codon:yes stop_codon:yes gene_type:complete